MHDYTSPGFMFFVPFSFAALKHANILIGN